MARKKASSPWDFGELFAEQELRQVWSVSDLTSRVRGILEKQFNQVWVSGEISNLRVQASGHMYFSLKDAKSQLNCVLFRSMARDTKGRLEDGSQVVLGGDVSVYEPRGQYQLIVREVELQGEGALQAAFERLKRKLNEEGLFAPERKRSLPRYPMCLGVVTSQSGAALKDVIHVLGRRHPGLRIVLFPSRVQGKGAENEIVDGIESLNAWGEDEAAPSGWRPELILITRGGGSLEDLWAFNEEILARAVAASRLPVVSAVGHEIDFTICDFAADVRAATPSAAAEIISEHVVASRQFLDEAPYLFSRLARRKLDKDADEVNGMIKRLRRLHPRRWIQDQFQRLDELEARWRRGGRRRHSEARQRLDHLKQRWKGRLLYEGLAHKRLHLKRLEQMLGERARARTLRERNRLSAATKSLKLLSVQNVLDRGYSITRDSASGRILRKAADVEAGARLETYLKDGKVVSVVESTDSI